MATLHITDLTLYTIIGTNAWERTKKQKVVINISMEYDSSQAVKNDDLKAAVDYKAIAKKIIRAVTASRFLLLESLADSVLTIIMDNKKVKKATVHIDKPKALRFAKSVSAELSARR